MPNTMLPVQKHVDVHEDVQLLASDIKKLSEAAAKMQASGLNRRALVVLLYDATSGVSKTAIEAVLDALPLLAERYTKP